MTSPSSSQPSAGNDAAAAWTQTRPVRARWIGLQDKLLLWNMLLITATLLCCGAAFMVHSGRQVRELKRQEVQHIAAAAAIAASPALADENHVRLTEVARQLLDVPEVSAITIYDAHGVPL